jgi:hypothetical protein
MRLRSASLALAGSVALAACSDVPTSVVTPAARAASTTGSIGINVVLKSAITDAARAQLAAYGRINDEVPEINALTMRIASGDLAAVQSLPIVAAAAPDAVRNGVPVDAVPSADFTTGISTWDLDAVNVTSSPGANTRAVAETGDGVYVGILDTGLLSSWRQYFPQERIATEYARAYGGGGGDVGNVSEQPNKWEQDQYSHGTHVTSTILGYQLGATRVTGVAPMAKVIPVKVLNQNGSGWSSTIARGIVYIADLKAGALAGHPMVINMSLGGGGPIDPMEKAAIDYAISKGVIVVAAAGNSGNAGVESPGNYQPVISVAATGWKQEFPAGNGGWWNNLDVPENDPTQYFIAGFSSKARPGQDLDVAAPGQDVVGPWQVNSHISYYYVSGTSMATPHVAGIVALMAQCKPSLTASQAEAVLTSSAVPIPGVAASAQGSGLALADRALAALAAGC